MPVREGDVLAGKYRVDRVLGIGGMGVVVAATHLQLEGRVALKFMLPDAYANAEAAARFTREARAAVKLKSEHVARVLDVGTLETGAPYIVMEYLDGTDLSGLLQKTGPLPVPDAAEYVLQACDAIAEAHSLGIVHRDLKPANLFLTRRGDGSPLVKVLDFGISKASTLNDTGLAMTKTAAMMGSPLYMSPEQMKSAKDVDARTDVWALGIILYELVGGRVPFNADTLGALMAAVMMEPPLPLRQVRPDIPESYAAIVGRCLEKDRARRCANVAEIAHALAEFSPARSRQLADRISTLLRVAPPPSAVSPAPSPYAGTVQDPAPHSAAPILHGPPLAASTGGIWAGTKPGEPARGGRFRYAPLLVIPVLVLAGAGLVGRRFWSAGHSAVHVVDTAPVELAAAVPATPAIVPSAPVTAAPAPSIAPVVLDAAVAVQPAPRNPGRHAEQPRSAPPTPPPTAAASAVPTVPVPSAAPKPPPKRPDLLEDSN